MARKNQWEQFADNFTTFYDMGNKLQTGMATRKIMDEAPEVVTMGGIKQPHQNYQATYDGKTYDKEITPEMLRGLQYDRIGDARTRFGDATGGMELREKAAGIRNDRATLEAQNLSNELERRTLEFNVQQAGLKTDSMKTDSEILEQKLAEMVANMPLDLANKELVNYGYKIDNSRNLIKFKTEKQTQKTEVKLKNLELEAAQVELANQKLLGAGYKIDNDGNLVQLGVDKSTAKNRIKKIKLDVDTQQQEIINKILVGNGLVLDNRGKVVTAEIAERTKGGVIAASNAEEEAKMQAAKLKSTTARLENNANVALLEYSKIIKEGGNFTNKAGKKITGAEWLREGWSGDAETLKVLKNIEDDELNQLMREGTMIIKNVEAALTGTRDMTEPAILKLIDDQDSIPNNVEILQSDEGEFLRMVQTDENGENPIVIAEGDNWSMFSDNLIASITPMKSVTLAKANADIALVQAQTAEINEKIVNNGIDIQKVNTEWAGIQEKMVEMGASPLEISTEKIAFVDSYITKTKGLGAGTNSDDKYEVIELP